MKKSISLFILATSAAFPQIQAEGFMPLLDQGKEWGYVEHGKDPVHNEGNIPSFYRIAVFGEKVINGREYKGIGSYAKFEKSYSKHVAYMREEGGKVYALYEEDCLDGHSSCYQAGKEYLLYDFNMKAGESMTLDTETDGGESIVLKCIETGVTETEFGARRYLKFDMKATPATQKWMTFEYLVEGIGPVGNCNFAMPYRSSEIQTSNDNTGLKTIDLLYQRLTGDPEECFQDDMVWTTPAFKIWGVHDPSVWCYQTKDSAGASVEEITMPVMPDMGIMLHDSDCGKTLTSINGDLTEVVVFDVLGKRLAEYSPKSREFRLDLGSFDTRIVIVRASTANSSRSFKLLNAAITE